jgi:hypothetical protein
MSAGSLGQGLSFAVGAALAGRLNLQEYRVYVLLGDGECDEGQVWEAAMAAAHFKVDNLVAIVDNNGLQIDGWNRDVMNLEPFNKKWDAFGWHVIEIDGASNRGIDEIRTLRENVKFSPTNGMDVLVLGYVDHYPQQGRTQFYVQDMKHAGEGERHILVEQWRLELAAEGLFAVERKRLLPEFPRKIGVVTSPTGAVIEDIKNIIADTNRCKDIVKNLLAYSRHAEIKRGNA